MSSIAILNRNNVSQTLFLRALTSTYQQGLQLFDPSEWLDREPELEEKMWRDADIRAAIDLRLNKIVQDWNLQPAGTRLAARSGNKIKFAQRPRSLLAVAVGSALLSKVEKFDEARKNLAEAFFHGMSAMRVHMKPVVLTIGDGRERTWMVPVRLEDLDKRYLTMRVHKNDRTDIETHWEEWNIAGGKWNPLTDFEALHTIRHTYNDNQSTLGYGRGLRDALGWWWYAKSHVQQEQLMAVSRFAQGILHARVDGARDADNMPNQEVVDAWTDLLVNLQARNILVSDAADNIEVIQGNAEGYQFLQDVVKQLKTTITTLVLGANLPTIAEGDGGSYALGGVQEDTTETLVQFDRGALDGTISDKLLRCIWVRNKANLVEMRLWDERPEFSTVQEKRRDPKDFVEVARGVHDMGADLSQEDVFDKAGLRIPEPGEAVIPGRAEQPAAFPPGMFGQ